MQCKNFSNERDDKRFNIGGSASNNGVEFESDDFIAQFVMEESGMYEVTYKKRLPVGRVRKLFSRIPIIKGFSALFDGKPILTLPILGLIALDFASATESVTNTNPYIILVILLATCVFILVSLVYVIKNVLYKIKKTWMFHGAEHKTIYTYDKGYDLTVENVRASPRIARRCGTNIAVFYILFLTVLWFVVDYQSIRLIGAFVLAYEMFDLKNGDKIPVLKVLFKFGHWCQQRIFTKEPTDIQLIASIETINKLIDLELSKEDNSGKI